MVALPSRLGAGDHDTEVMTTPAQSQGDKRARYETCLAMLPAIKKGGPAHSSLKPAQFSKRAGF